ncbi:hypothetical protein [Bradyrhizobium sp. dw_78]|uniref:hypothetical protein n=1 Tax=Bradyrhizobium sp. dw_78 TaxID=2719793 RepID=UPI001BD3688A|nr:hypothetical protein [Bradyrhizobium sp. dw_78]
MLQLKDGEKWKLPASDQPRLTFARLRRWGPTSPLAVVRPHIGELHLPLFLRPLARRDLGDGMPFEWSKFAV